MKRVLILLALAGCAGGGPGAMGGGASALSPVTSQPEVKAPNLTCHPHDHFIKKGKLERNGHAGTRAGTHYAFIGATVWNHLRQTTIQAYPFGGAGGSEVLTILPGHAEQESFAPPVKGITVVIEGTGGDSGPGVEINATSCLQQ